MLYKNISGQVVFLEDSGLAAVPLFIVKKEKKKLVYMGSKFKTYNKYTT
jgi:hypothetical protein